MAGAAPKSSTEHKSAAPDSDRLVFHRCGIFFDGQEENALDSEKTYEVKATVDITKLHCSDMTHQREGTVVMNLNGQGSAISWRGRSSYITLATPFHRDNPLVLRPNSKNNLTDQTVFFGRPKHGRITAQVSVIESDDYTRTVLEKIGNWAAQASGAANSAPVPATVGLGLGLASKAFALSSKVVDNDLELLAVTSIDRTGTYTVVREDGGVKCVLEVTEVVPADLDNGPVTVTLVSMESPAGSKPGMFPIKYKGKGHFVFSSTMGSGGAETEFSVSAPHNNGGVPVDSILGMRNAVLFSGEWPKGLPLPVSVSAGTTAKEDKLDEPIEELIDSSAALATEALPDAAVQVANITKAAQGVLSVVYNLRPLFMKDLRQTMGTISVAKEGHVRLDLGGKPNVTLNLYVSHGSSLPPPPPPYAVKN